MLDLLYMHIVLHVKEHALTFKELLSYIVYPFLVLFLKVFTEWLEYV